MWQGTNRDKVYEELGWESLHLRRWFRRLTVFYKVMTGLTPQYLRDPVPSPRSHLYGTSSKNDLHPMRCRTQRFQNSFYPDAVKCWNDIGPEIRKSDSLQSFKVKLNGIIKPKCKSIYNIHSTHLKYLFQLRSGLSPLKAHKFRHNFKDTPNASCLCSTGAETTTHFLLLCPLFKTHREKLMKTIKPFTANLDLNSPQINELLLYGLQSLKDTENKAILEASLQFIADTGRFQP